MKCCFQHSSTDKLIPHLLYRDNKGNVRPKDTYRAEEVSVYVFQPLFLVQSASLFLQPGKAQTTFISNLLLNEWPKITKALCLFNKHYYLQKQRIIYSDEALFTCAFSSASCSLYWRFLLQSKPIFLLKWDSIEDGRTLVILAKIHRNQMGFQLPQKMLAHIVILKANLQIKNPISSMQKTKSKPISN